VIAEGWAATAAHPFAPYDIRLGRDCGPRNPRLWYES
jgi:hypothetical protein